MTPKNATKFYKELLKFSVEELKILHDMPFTSKTVNIEHLKELLSSESLIAVDSFDYYFRMYLPLVLFDKIDNLNKK